MSQLLSPRELNRATLARQLLLLRAAMPVRDALEHLVGVQAQAPAPPYVGLWARLERFEPQQLGRLLESRRAVRLALMRSTIHLVTARDCLALYPVLRPVEERNLFSGSPYGRRLKGIDLDALLNYGRALLEEKPRTLSELRGLLSARWRAFDGQAMAYAVRNLLPLVQVPPRGVWGKSGAPACTTADSWIGKPMNREGDAGRLVMRYLRAFGPASVKDAQVWSGLRGLGEVFERLRRRLRTFRSETGAELFDVPEAPRPRADVAAPVRFLPEFDNLLLSHADRTRMMDDEHRKRIGTLNGMVPGTLLIDGRVAGIWRLERTGRQATTLRLHTFARLRASLRDQVAPEGESLLRFIAPAAERIDIRFDSMHSL